MISTVRRRRLINVTEVRQALERVVAADPDHADRRTRNGLPARYVSRGEPNSLVARVLAELGFSVGVLRSLDHEPPTGELFEVGVAVHESRHAALKKIDPTAMALLAFVQEGQDKGEKAERILRRAFQAGWLFPRRARLRKPWLAGA